MIPSQFTESLLNEGLGQDPQDSGVFIGIVTKTVGAGRINVDAVPYL
jgi:hypothetical protein